MNWPQKEEEIEDGPAIIKISDERSIGKVLGKNGQTIQSIEVVCGTRVQINQQVDPAVVSVSGDKLGVLFTLWIISDCLKTKIQILNWHFFTHMLIIKNIIRVHHV
eukprot:TRINITY_DN3353_c0_g4_i1.p1 TRINITY_DN3353_c0_g4~~TRINITY_DN3353_c0_g4_i1.p1  ORF type:complete len:106 (-),score=4.66 TRINITY_DN3353_c0_g4_i1:55-372(-)